MARYKPELFLDHAYDLDCTNKIDYYNILQNNTTTVSYANSTLKWEGITNKSQYYQNDNTVIVCDNTSIEIVDTNTNTSTVIHNINNIHLLRNGFYCYEKLISSCTKKFILEEN